MQTVTTICDNCGVPRGSGNHWWMAVEHLCSDGLPSAIHLYPWDDNGYGDKTLHLCGERCVLAKVSQFMAGGQQ